MSDPDEPGTVRLAELDTTARWFYVLNECQDVECVQVKSLLSELINL